jgi:epoxyqueuosine reductase
MRPEVDRMKLRDYLSSMKRNFAELFAIRQSSGRKRRGLLRKCLRRAWEMSAHKNDLPALEKTLRAPNQLVAEHAQWAIGRIIRNGRLRDFLNLYRLLTRI